MGGFRSNLAKVGEDTTKAQRFLLINASGELITSAGATLSVISKTTAVTIGTAGANTVRLAGITVLAALTGTCAITGFADSDGTAQTITFPALTAAGFKDLRGAINAAGSLTVTCSNAADDNLVLVHWITV